MRKPLFVVEPARQTPIIAETEVMVVGGGSAGLAAATAAARNGAATMLVERYGYLGGMATGGLIILLLSLDDGTGRQVIGGLCQELVDRLEQREAVYYPRPAECGSRDPALVNHYRHWGLIWGHNPPVRYAVAYDPEQLKLVADEIVTGAGVQVRFHTWAAGVLREGDRLRGVLVEGKEGRGAILANVIIDASGDGDLLREAQVPWEKEDSYPWLWFRMGNVAQPDVAIETSAVRFSPTLGGFFFRTPGTGRTLMPWGAADAASRKIGGHVFGRVELGGTRVPSPCPCRGSAPARQHQRIRASIPVRCCGPVGNLRVAALARTCSRARERGRESGGGRRGCGHGQLDQAGRDFSDPVWQFACA